MKPKIFIDGHAGTTGLKIVERLKDRTDLKLLKIDPAKRKDSAEKKKIFREADLVFLCLSDQAAKESVSLIDGTRTRIIDASTAHRHAPGWVYGFPELPQQRAMIKKAKAVSVPGCYATGFIAAVNPIFSVRGEQNDSTPLVSWAITGFSGGGKPMIEDYLFAILSSKKDSIVCRPKNLDLGHKHLPEMRCYGQLSQTPTFVPMVGNFYQGMLVFIVLNGGIFRNDEPNVIREFLNERYAAEKFIRVASEKETNEIGSGFITPTELNNTNKLEIFVFGKKGEIVLVSRLDNLGKGSSGAAVQNMNIMLGLPEETGLI